MRISDTLRSLPAIKAREQIPPHRRKSQFRRTVIGGFVFVGGFFIPVYLHFPWQVGLGVSAFGGFMASKELVLDFLKAIPQAIAAIANAVGGKKPDA